MTAHAVVYSIYQHHTAIGYARDHLYNKRINTIIMDIKEEFSATTVYDHANDRTVFMVANGTTMIGCNFLQGEDTITQTDPILTAHVIAYAGSNMKAEGWLGLVHEAMWDYIQEDAMWAGEMHGY